jgi:hypothetical protein
MALDHWGLTLRSTGRWKWFSMLTSITEKYDSNGIGKLIEAEMAPKGHLLLYAHRTVLHLSAPIGHSGIKRRLSVKFYLKEIFSKSAPKMLTCYKNHPGDYQGDF